MFKVLPIALLLMLSTVQIQAGEVMVNGTKMDAVVIDVRTVGEFAAGHIEGAINVPVEQIETGILSVKGLKKDSQILVYCRSGRRSAYAKGVLEKMGYKKINDGGGMEALARNFKNCSANAC